MQISSFLKKVEARASLRDSLKVMLCAASLIGFVFLSYAAADYFFNLSFRPRLVITACLALATISALAFDLARKNRRRGLIWAATQVEQKTGTLDNQLVTIAEHEMTHSKLPSYLRVRIEDNLARHLGSTTAAQIISLRPGRRVSLMVFSVLAIYSLAVVLWPQALRVEFKRLVLLNHSDNFGVASAATDEPALSGDDNLELRLVLTPPAYTRRSPAVQVEDGNIIALAGTRADVHIKTRQELSLALLSVGGASASEMIREGEHSYRASFIVDQDSNYQVSLTGLDGENRKREEVYSIRAVKDRPPETHITSPASDMLFEPESRPASVSIAVTAKDDYEVASMKLKYIKATGEGDAAKFQSGEIAINRLPEDAEGRTRGTARLDLVELGVAGGASIVFHAEAADRNDLSGPGLGYSENIIVQVRGAEPLKISLDDLRPDEALKYLTSQRMILIKTERLHRLRAKIAADDFLARSQQIASEQKRFKESFNQFTEIESSGEHTGDNQAGDNDARQDSDGSAPLGSAEQMKLRSGDVPESPASGIESLREMILAIRAMWKAEGALGAAETGRAIEFENEALVHLKAAQKGLRYSPRIISSAKPVDLKRRYMGALEGIRSRIERVPRKQESAFDQQLRGALALVYDAARALAPPEKERVDADQRIVKARQDIERAAGDLLSIKGELASSLPEPASKLKLVARMLGAVESFEQRDKAFALTVQVASEMSALLGRETRAGIALSPNNLTPAARAKAAAYFKLLANP
jgi:hypothetical protein